jgi:hypothetical protein
MKRLALLLFVALPMLLAACVGQLQVPSQSHILTVKIQASDSVIALEQRYAGTMLSWQPHRKVAILKTERLPVASDPAVMNLETNQTLQTTEGRLGVERPANLKPTVDNPLQVADAANPLQVAGANPLQVADATDPLQVAGAATKGSIIGMSGWSTWSSGWQTWASSWSVWSNSSGTLPPLPSSNTAAFQNIRLPQAHAIAKNYGAGITVAVLDTGIDLNHPGFVGKLAASSLYKDFVGNDTNPSEELGWALGHGTAVAGLILQVAPAAKILPIRVLSSNGSGDLNDLIAGIDHAVRSGAKVINVSLGTVEYSEALAVMIQFAQANQVYVVAAAGNNSRQDQSDYPAKLAETDVGWNYTFGVGSVKNNDTFSDFTNRGSDVTFYAPGEGMTTFFPGNATINATGTSFAAPLFSGALALGLSNTDPSHHAVVGSYLRYYQEQQSIWWTVNNIGQTPWAHNYGRLDLEHFLLSLPNFIPNNARVGRTDLVINGAFEQGWTGWTLGGVAQLDSFTDYFSGYTSMVLNRIGWISQRLTNLQPNTTYLASAWIRVSRASQSATFGVKNFGRSTVSKAVTGAANFQKVVLEFTTGTSATTADLYFEKTLGTAIAVGDLFSVVRK